MLQMQSMMLPGKFLSRGALFSASVTAPQWQLPWYVSALSMSAVGSGPSYLCGS